MVTSLNRVTGTLLDVLEIFLHAVNDDAELHGWASTKATKRSGPTVYGVLDRLEGAAWITGRWEDQHPESNKPRRRLYRLTPIGITGARDLRPGPRSAPRNSRRSSMTALASCSSSTRPRHDTDAAVTTNVGTAGLLGDGQDGRHRPPR